MKIWKEGDRVTVEDTLSFHEGETGTVVRVVGRWQYPVFVKFSDGNIGNFKYDELVKAHRESEYAKVRSTPLFNCGYTEYK